MSSDPLRMNQAPDRTDSVISAYLDRGFESGLMLFAFLILFERLNHLLEYLFLLMFGVWVIRELVSKQFRFVRTPMDAPLLLFLAWVLITVATSIDPAYSFAEWRKMVTKVLMLYFVVHVITEQAQVRRILLAFVAGACAQGMLAVIQSAVDGWQPFSMAVREGGWTTSSQWLSSYLVMSLPLFWLGGAASATARSRVLYGLAACPVLVALFLAHTRAAWVALIFQVLVFALIRKTRHGLWTVGVTVLVLGALFTLLAWPGTPQELLRKDQFTQTYSMAVRFQTWGVAMEDLSRHPLTGIGFGQHTFSMVHPESWDGAFHTHIHNTFLSMAVQVGLPGLLLFGGLFASIFRSCFQWWKAASDQYPGQLALALLLTTVGVLVRNLFDDMFVGMLVYSFWLLLGLTVVLNKGLPGGGEGPKVSE